MILAIINFYSEVALARVWIAQNSLASLGSSGLTAAAAFFRKFNSIMIGKVRGLASGLFLGD